jgi:phage gpG-like protein
MVALDIHFEPAMIISARKVDKLGLSIRSFREPLKRSIQQVMIPSIRKNFDAEGRPSWQQLAPATVKRRGSSHPILRQSGALAQVATQLNIWTIDTEKAYIRDLPESVWYGKVQQAGFQGTRQESALVANVRRVGTGSGGGFRRSLYASAGQQMANDNTGSSSTPARPFIVLQKQDEVRIKAVFNVWLKERIAAAGLAGR